MVVPTIVIFRPVSRSTWKIQLSCAVSVAAGISARPPSAYAYCIRDCVPTTTRCVGDPSARGGTPTIEMRGWIVPTGFAAIAVFTNSPELMNVAPAVVDDSVTKMHSCGLAWEGVKNVVTGVPALPPGTVVTELGNPAC